VPRLDTCDPDLAAATIHTNRDLVAGIKVRIDRYSVGGNGLDRCAGRSKWAPPASCR